ncbi:MAG: hypothetical protein H6Q72_4721 [Firmicutes bacterium]|nr:hypothetical protein [Bacillota bacterium]
MDSLIPLLLMLLLYLVPELLKRRKNPKEYEYPDIPAKVPQPVEVKPVENKTKPLAAQVPDYALSPAFNGNVVAKPAMVMPEPVDVPHLDDLVSPWQGKLSPQIVQNGLIFAEILQPPRAYRPLWRRPK